MRETDNEGDANMEWDSMQVSGVAVAELPLQYKKAQAPAVSKAKPAKSGTSAPACAPSGSPQSRCATAGKEYSIGVPAMMNKKAVAADEELVVYRRLKRKDDKAPAPVKVARLMRTAK